MGEVKLMKGNEALAEAAIRAGVDAYFGYPITPQSEVIEYLSREATKRTGMLVLQAESEVAAINMIYGAAGCGKKAMTTSSSPGISLMQEGLSYIASAELPCLLANINRGGPGLGTIQPAQGDYFQTTKGGGHGDYHLLVLAPYNVQEMADFVKLGFDLAFKYRNPVMILADGALGQMMEKVELPPQLPRENKEYPWATTGKPKNGERRIITSLHIQPEKMEEINLRLQRKYKQMEAEEVRYQTKNLEDAEYVFTAFGLVSRIALKAMDIGRQKGYKIGWIRPITLYPFPKKIYAEIAPKVKGILDIEMNAGQMVEDVMLSVQGKTRVEFYGRMGGVVPTPDEILENFEKMFIKGE
ncbi:3-methyl-2-oxobutanoate dehydrogenase subunit VorB [Bacteroidetes/Chlorobi group bacterium MS-B_bin-24]|jgi:2-oxoglutarate ferredoxin oxidoreductase subunit alpha|nr:MAG: 3-methyl-2-oxobutanoate dehydrogenase subunit VorB [Bacteroidetes/Chlorobi group bacterium MS-B_bin-24]